MKTATRPQAHSPSSPTSHVVVGPPRSLSACPGVQLLATDTDASVVQTPIGKFVQVSPAARLVVTAALTRSPYDAQSAQQELGDERFDRIVQSLTASGILTSPDDPEPESTPTQGQRTRRLHMERLTLIRCELLSGRRALTALARVWQAAASRSSVLAGVALVSLYGLVMVGVQIHRHGFSSGQDTTPGGALLAVALICVATIAHELAHGLELERRGAKAGGFGVMLLWFMPAAYCDVSTVWTIPDRRGRVAVSAAGPIVSLFIGGLGAIVFSVGYDPAWLRLFLFVNLAILAFNLSPFFRTDTYWMISHWLRRPRLLAECRHQARRMLRRRSRGGDGFSWMDALYGAAGVVVMPVVVAGYWLA